MPSFGLMLTNIITSVRNPELGRQSEPIIIIRTWPSTYGEAVGAGEVGVTSTMVGTASGVTSVTRGASPVGVAAMGWKGVGVGAALGSAVTSQPDGEPGLTLAPGAVGKLQASVMKRISMISKVLFCFIDILSRSSKEEFLLVFNPKDWR